MEKLIIDAHSHLWLRQNTTWNGLAIRTTKNGRSLFLGEEVQMLPPFMIDGQNTAEVFLSNMDYAQVAAAVVVQEFIDGLQNDYLLEVSRKYPQRFFVCGMADYLQEGFFIQAKALIEQGFRGIAIPGHRLLGRKLTSDEMMQMFRLMEEKDVILSITLADGPQQVGELREVIQECPRLKIAIGHLGMANPPASPPWENPDWQEQIKLALGENVFIESGGITWLYNSEFYPFPSAIRAIREAAELVGMEKLMWGSDYPRTITAITYRMSYDFVLKSPELSDAEKRLFLGENARRFYGFGELPDLPYIKNMSE
ncbi:MAG: amidohydrolase [Bacteroidaceae bacterium]|nr:amidohydrolase [Bacteroidaceae bacterium]